jgi:1,4-alpha-glucan branching enzyme
MNHSEPFYRKDPWLKPFTGIIDQRHNAVLDRLEKLTGGRTLKDFASGHLYYGMQKDGDDMVFREFAPNATEICLTGTFNGWKEEKRFSLNRIDRYGNWEIRVKNNEIPPGSLYKMYVRWEGGSGERIPSYAISVVQDDATKLFAAVNIINDGSFIWKHPSPVRSDDAPLVYEAHTGMASEEQKVASFSEFRTSVLPRIRRNGYNTIQLMAVQEHPYYGSFGYHVSNFFAVSSRFGTPDDLRELIDEAHGMGIAVIIDLVHSHSVSNVNEGLALLDGDPGLYFHTGPRRVHPAWNSLCFNYGSDHVLHFLLSNCRYWIEEFNIDGFRFDGVTSMIYYDHGLGRDFTSYGMYYDGNQDSDALVYLSLANRLIHEIRPGAITVAEEMSGMPGIASSWESKGTGFDYRLAMGVPDFWIKLIKEIRDEDWDMEHLFYELTQHRPDEKTISYCESHDQALVGDKTIIFRLMDAAIYSAMQTGSVSLDAERGVALHKMIRLITATTAQSGYLNFMGNEFGHPEWIDFPREGNNWSYLYARRQWSLADNSDLRYSQLLSFDNGMVKFLRESGLLEEDSIVKVSVSNHDKIIAFRRSKYLLVFNFHPGNSYPGYSLPVKGRYKIVLDTDSGIYGGFDRIDHSIDYISFPEGERVTVASPFTLKLYLPSRTAVILEELPPRRITGNPS